MYLMLLLLVSAPIEQRPKVSVIAHAGGGIQGSTYTNSFEALNLNYANGFELFELDFSWTSDQHLVCLHDWQKTPKWLLNYDEQKPLTYAEFKAHDERRTDVTLCDLPSLNQWLKAHPKAYVVTDIKVHNTTGLELMLDNIDQAKTRIIPQFNQPEEYQTIKAMGFESIIWSLYLFKGNNQRITELAVTMDLFAITLPPHKAKGELPKTFRKLKIPTYVHTINDMKVALKFQQVHQITSIYTDFLNPNFDQQQTPIPTYE